MPRVTRGTNRIRRRKKILRLARGYRGAKSKLHRAAKEQVMRSLAFAYRHRRQKKRNFRSLWIVRISAAARQNGLSYSQLIDGLKKAGLDLNRKMLAEIAVRDSQGFSRLAEKARQASS
ncbi:MAG: 50S ribosomal protein L20 [Acidobacteriota bacterium]